LGNLTIDEFWNRYNLKKESIKNVAYLYVSIKFASPYFYQLNFVTRIYELFLHFTRVA